MAMVGDRKVLSAKHIPCPKEKSGCPDTSKDYYTDELYKCELSQLFYYFKYTISIAERQESYCNLNYTIADISRAHSWYFLIILAFCIFVNNTKYSLAPLLALNSKTMVYSYPNLNTHTHTMYQFISVYLYSNIYIPYVSKWATYPLCCGIISKHIYRLVLPKMAPFCMEVT